MKGISRFFTIYWIIYFPTCIAYNDLPGFSSVDEAMTVLLFVYTLWMYSHNRSINKRPWKEFTVCISLIVFYTPQIRNLIGCSGTMPEKLQGSFSSTRSLYKRNVRRHKPPLPHKAA